MKEKIRRQRYLIDYTVSSLRRRPAKNLFLLFAYTLIVFLLASIMMFTAGLRQEATTILKASPEIVIQKLVAGRHALIPESYLEKVNAIRGTTAPHGRLWGYFYDPAVQANYTLMAAPHKALDENEIAIGAAIARSRDLGIGDYLSFRSSSGIPTSFKVVEILTRNSEIVSADLLLMNEESWRHFFGVQSGYYTDLVMGVRNSKEITKVAEKILLALPDTRPILREEILRTYDSIFNWRQGIAFVIFSVAILAFIIFAWDKASGLSAEERREIGVLKATGWDTKDIMRMKIWEGSLISVSAFFIGYLMAYAHVMFSDAVIFTQTIKGWSTLYPQFTLTPAVDLLQIATLFFFTVFPYTAATLTPVWQAATTDPDQVMR